MIHHLFIYRLFAAVCIVSGLLVAPSKADTKPTAPLPSGLALQPVEPGGRLSRIRLWVEQKDNLPSTFRVKYLRVWRQGPRVRE